MATMTKMTTDEQLLHALKISDQKAVLLFKHSTRCPISTRAYKEVQVYLQNEPNEKIDYVMIDVIADRPISDAAAASLNVKHESPQVILVSQGVPVWHTSHSNITTEALRDKLDSL
ncbi:bacillithiol system redox-active protein YtxJ [Paenibacillus dakarensis]|uniref:bacillithiol system redox-active protein YtxJ n=1 Tax=Paenibacillus dakarensis TaxID=1527293 RepID=UPI0006D58B74|nr:bacillithiol system redox-active protein YtxJ [Paenibacillus dakarensis]